MPNSRGMVCRTRRRTYVRIEEGLAFVEHAIDVPQHPVRQDAGLQVAELVADGHRVVENRQPDQPCLFVHDRLNLFIRLLLGPEIRVRDDLVEQVIDTSLLRRGRLLLLDEPLMSFAARAPDILAIRWTWWHPALESQQNRLRSEERRVG